MKRNMVLAAVAAVGLAASGAMAGTVVVHSFAANTSTAGVWGNTDVRTGGSATIVTAPTGGPLPPGAALLTTDATDAAKAEVGIANNYGTASSIVNTINLAYSYYKTNTGGNASAAPSLKLTFFDASYVGDGFVTLIYEPYYNMVSNPATDTWLSSGTIDATHGLFWENGGFGQANQAGGAYATNNTISGWLTAFNGTSGNAFNDATLVGVQMGVGTYNQSQHDFFDDVSINGTAIADTTYNFEPVPLPSAAWGGLALLGCLGLAGGFKRMRKQQA